MFYDLFFFIIFFIFILKFDFFNTPAINSTKNITNYEELKTSYKNHYFTFQIKKIKDFFKQNNFFDFLHAFITKKHTKKEHMFIYSILLIYLVIFILKWIKKGNNKKRVIQINEDDIELEANDFGGYGFYSVFKIKENSKSDHKCFYVYFPLKNFKKHENLSKCIKEMIEKYKNGLYVPKQIKKSKFINDILVYFNNYLNIKNKQNIPNQ